MQTTVKEVHHADASYIIKASFVVLAPYQAKDKEIFFKGKVS